MQLACSRREQSTVLLPPSTPHDAHRFMHLLSFSRLPFFSPIFKHPRTRLTAHHLMFNMNPLPLLLTFCNVTFFRYPSFRIHTHLHLTTVTY